jgi:hypothetical protein
MVSPKEYPELYFEVVDSYIAKRLFPFAMSVLELMAKEDEV